MAARGSSETAGDASAPSVEAAHAIVVSVRGLGHRFGANPYLWRHVSFDVRRGEVVALCGRSGSGKSTMLSLIAGWERPTEGSIARPADAVISWVFQNPYGASSRTVIDIAAFPFVARGLTRRAAEDEARHLLELFGLGPLAGSLFSELSGGEAQRLMLVRAIGANPDILLVDEPTAQLDTTTADVVNGTLSALAVGGAAVIVATHDPRTRDACDRVVDLNDFAHADGAAEAGGLDMGSALAGRARRAGGTEAVG